jgi:hypothetical protein
MWGDYDNDGDLDLALVNSSSGGRLFRNEAGASFTDVTSGPLALVGAQSARWVDYDLEGHLDLWMGGVDVAGHLLRNEGGSVFVDATSGPLVQPFNPSSSSWADYDDDGDPDLFVVSDTPPNRLLRNDGAGVFADVAAGAIADVAGRGSSWVDVDNDGDLDLYVSNSFPTSKLLRNDGDGAFADVTAPPLGGGSGSWPDYDNDGDVDFFTSTGLHGFQLLRNEGGGVFADVTGGPLVGGWFARSPAWADVDGDGDEDCFIADLYGEPHLFENRTGSLNHWLQVDLVGRYSNRAGIGARIRVVAAGTSHVEEVHGMGTRNAQGCLTATFGLGTALVADTLEVRWPSGMRQIVSGLPVDMRIEIREPIMTPTPPGDLVVVQLGADVRLVFNHVTSGGTTQLTETNVGPGTPSGVVVMPADNPIYYDLYTTAAATGAISVCIDYDPARVGPEEDLLLLHLESGVWTSITTSVDTLSNLICGLTDHLSPFVIARVTGALSTPEAGEDPPSAPRTTRLFAPHPNPARARVDLAFEVAAEGRVQMSVFDLQGRLVRRIVDDVLPPGDYARSWDGRSETQAEAAAGIYFVVFRQHGVEQSRKVFLVR